MIFTNHSLFPSGIEFRILERPPNLQPFFSGHADLPTRATRAWELQTFQIRTGANPAELQIAANEDVDIFLSSISLIEQRSVMDFDTHDKRYNWRNDNTGARAFILPDGWVTGTPNWAGLVESKPGPSGGQDWPLRNRQLAILANHRQRLCFDVKQYTGPLMQNPWGVLRVKSANNIAVLTIFLPTPTWNHVCSDWFNPASSDNNVQFGLNGNQPGNSSVSYLVDNITVVGQ